MINAIGNIIGRTLSGGGALLLEPAVQTSFISIIDATSQSHSVVAGRGDGGFILVVGRAGLEDVNFVPVNDTHYQLGEDLGGGNFVVYIGTESQFLVEGLEADTLMNYKAFEFNSNGSNTSYNIEDPPIASERTFTSEYQAVLEYDELKGFSPPSTLSDKMIDNELIRESKSIGLWDAAPRFYNHHTLGSMGHALVDYKNPSDATLAELVSSPTYTEKGGFDGDGIDDAINYKFALDALGSLITNTDFGIIALAGGGNIAENSVLYGVVGGGRGCYLMPRRATNVARYVIGDNTATDVSNSDSRGLWDIRRKPDGNKQMIHEGSVIDTSAIAAETLSSAIFHGLCWINNGTLAAFHSGRLDMLIPYKQSLVSPSDIKAIMDNHRARVASVVPTLLSASIEEESTDELNMVFNIAVNITSTGWTIETNGDPVTISSISGSGTKSPKLTLSREIDPTETISISYSQSAGNTAALIGTPLGDITDFFFELNFMVFGDLSEMFPTLNAQIIKNKRQINWEKFKIRVLDSIDSEQVMTVDPGRLELYFPVNDTIEIDNGDVCHIQLSPETEIVTYPHYRDTPEYLFEVKYGGDLKLEGGSIHQYETCKFEVYNVRLRDGGNSKKIAILGTVRPSFWTDIKVGTRINYNWGFETSGAFSTITSWSQTEKTITINDDISESIDDNLSGQYVVIGLKFKENISTEDYNQYGDYWNWENDPSSPNGAPQISLIRANPTGDAATQHIRLKDIQLSKFFVPVLISSDKMELHLEGVVGISLCQIGISFFYKDGGAVGENYIRQSGELHLFENGYIIRGGHPTADNLLGGGGYTAPNIQEHFDGVLRLTDNKALAWRQYSSQGTKPVNPGDNSYFTEIIATGNMEADVMTSNSLPTTIYKITSTGIVRPGGDVVILDGDINRIAGSATQQPDAGVAFEVSISNAVIRGIQTFSYSSTRQSNLTIKYSSCVFPTKKVSSVSSIILADNNLLKRLELTDCLYEHDLDSGVTPIGSSGSVLASALIRLSNFAEIILTNLEVEAFKCTLFNTSSFNPNVVNEFRMDNPNINCDRITTLSNLSATSILGISDGINSTFSGTIDIFKESGFTISADGVNTIDDTLSGDAWSVTFDDVPVVGTPVVGSGTLKDLI